MYNNILRSSIKYLGIRMQSEFGREVDEYRLYK